MLKKPFIDKTKIDVKSIYWKRYKGLIQSRRYRDLGDDDYELHHVIPKCAGGEDHWNNIIKLTFREHFLAHWMLSKCGIGSSYYKLRLAYGVMGRSSKHNDYRRIVSSRVYEIWKRESKKVLNEWIKASGNTLKGAKWYTDEEGSLYRCKPRDKRIKQLGLQLTEGPSKGKAWYTDGVKFFMLNRWDLRIKGLGLTKQAPSRGKAKNFSESSAKKLSKDRAGRAWYHKGEETFKLKPNDPLIKSLKLVKGRVFTDQAKKNISKGASWKRTKADNLANSERQMGRSRYNDGTRNYTLDKGDPRIKKLGLMLGEIISKRELKRRSLAAIGTKWFTNGEQNLRLKPDERVPRGFRLGQTRTK
jgi:hypothetical protein